MARVRVASITDPNAPWVQPGSPQPPGQPGWSGGPPPQVPRQSGAATASLILGICAFLVCPLVCSVLAIVYGNKARAEIRASNGWVTGEGQAKAGLILGWVSLALTALLILAIALPAAFSS